jgi:hypothetical protein
MPELYRLGTTTMLLLEFAAALGVVLIFAILYLAFGPEGRLLHTVQHYYDKLINLLDKEGSDDEHV